MTEVVCTGDIPGMPAGPARVRKGTAERTRRSAADRDAWPAGTLSRKTSPLNSPLTGPKRYAARMGELIGYARCSTVIRRKVRPGGEIAKILQQEDRP